MVVRALYETLQTILAVLWTPFKLVSRIGLLVSLGGRWLGDNLIRHLYWSVVQAKRKKIGQPLWQQHDFRIGIGPPCEHCGVNVPPGRHAADCTFLLPQSGSLSIVDFEELSKMSARESVIQSYFYALQKDGVKRDDIADAIVVDIRKLSERFPVELKRIARTCRQVAAKLETRAKGKYIGS